MKSKFVCSISAAIVLFCIAAFSQSDSPASAALPPAPGAAASPAAIAPNPNATKVGAVNVERAILLSNEGQRDMGALQKKLEPKLAELKTKSDELEALNKQLNAAATPQEKKDDITRQIDLKKKAYDRARQDLQDDAQGQQGEIGNRILQKMGPFMVKWAQDNGFGMIIDTSAQWPQGPVLWVSPATLDITEAMVTAYNAQSGVAAPAAGTPTKPAPARSTPATKPSTTAPPK